MPKVLFMRIGGIKKEGYTQMLRFIFAKSILLAAFLNFAVLVEGSLAQQLMSSSSSETSDNYFDMNLEELMEVDIRTGKPGWFGTQLEQLTLKPYVHGYAVVDYRDYDLNRGKPIDTFDMHYFNIIVGANIEEKIAAEVLLKYEHGGDDLGIRYGIIDYKIAEPAILLLGKFLVLMGKFNEFLSPEYANKLPDRPKCLWNIVPIVWAESGVQLRGEYELTSDQSVNYAFYVVNGLEQSAGEGGNIRNMRGNNRDSNHSNKAYGGRIGFKPAKNWKLVLHTTQGHTQPMVSRIFQSWTWTQSIRDKS